MTTYRLQSTALIYTPGIVRWAVNGYHFKRDRRNLTNVLTSGYGLPVEVAKALLSGKVPYTVEDETVVFEVAA